MLIHSRASILLGSLAAGALMLGAWAVDDASLLELPVFMGLPLDLWIAAIPILWVTAYFAWLTRVAEQLSRHRSVLRTFDLAAVADRQLAPSRSVLARLEHRRSWHATILAWQFFPGIAVLWTTFRFLDLHDPVVTLFHAAAAAVCWVIGWIAFLRVQGSRGGMPRLLRRVIRARRYRTSLLVGCSGLLVAASAVSYCVLVRQGFAHPIARLAPVAPPEGFLPPQGGGSTGAVLDYSGRGLEGAQLAKIRWAGAKLSGVSLRGANLREADLSGIHTLHEQGWDVACRDLPDERFRAVDLSFADLRGAQLVGADLRCASLRGANLENANLEGANLLEADLRNIKATRVRLSGANLGRATLDGGDLQDASLTGAFLDEASVRSALLSGARMQMIRLLTVDLSNSRLDRADLTGAFLINTDVAGASWRDAKMSALVQIGSGPPLPGSSRRAPEASEMNRFLCRDFFLDRAATSTLPEFMPSNAAERRIWVAVEKRAMTIRRYVRGECPSSLSEEVLTIDNSEAPLEIPADPRHP